MSSQERAVLTPQAIGVSRRLAEFVVQTRFEDLSPCAVEMTKRVILDALGVSLAASGLDPLCKPFVEQALSLQGRAESSLIGLAGKVPAELAALANGALAHALDFEDTHEPSQTHPNAAAIPAALAVTEALGNVDGKSFITAIAVGCEIATRLSLAGDPQDAGGRSKGFYPPPLFSTFGATAAVAHLLGLDATQVLDAFSLTLCRSSYSAELIDSPQSHLRAIREGFAAQTAVSACQLAARGVRGFELPFEGAAGFYHLYGSGRFDSSRLLAGLGESWQIEATSFKAWPSCRGTHLYLQAALELQQRHAFAMTDIDSISACITPFGKMLVEPAASKMRPMTAIDAKFSIPFTVATALVHGAVTLDSYSPQALQDSRVLDLAGRMTYRMEPEVARPRSEGGGDCLHITLRNGTVLSGGVECLYGSVQQPMSQAELLQKFVDCASHAPKRRTHTELASAAATLLSLENVSDVGTVLPLLL